MQGKQPRLIDLDSRPRDILTDGSLDAHRTDQSLLLVPLHRPWKNCSVAEAEGFLRPARRETPTRRGSRNADRSEKDPDLGRISSPAVYQAPSVSGEAQKRKSPRRWRGLLRKAKRWKDDDRPVGEEPFAARGRLCVESEAVTWGDGLGDLRYGRPSTGGPGKPRAAR